MGLSDIMKPDPSFFAPLQEMIDSSIAAAELGDLSEAQIQAIVDAAVGAAEADDLTEAQVQALIDDAIAAIPPSEGGGGPTRTLTHDKVFLQTGDVAVPAAMVEGAFVQLWPAGQADLVLTDVQIGDDIEVDLDCMITSGNGEVTLDVGSIVGGVVAHRFGSPANRGQGWYQAPNLSNGISGTRVYTVQAGDLVGGVLTIRPLIWNSGSAGVVYARDDYAFAASAKNIGPSSGNIIPSGGGGLTLIEQKVVAVAAATLNFAAIPNIFRGLKLEIVGKGTNASVISALRMQLNGDASLIYDDENNYRQDGAAGGASMVGYGAAHLGYLGGANNGRANRPGLVIVEFPAYARTDFEKVWRAFNSYADGAASGYTISDWAGWWRSVAAINQIILSLDAGNFAVGTVANLYGY